MTEPTLIVVRHGETSWSRSGQHTSRTDLDLTPRGVQQAEQIGAVLSAVRFDLVLSSPRLRARHTAELAGLTPLRIEDDLVEWDYGEMEGLTTVQIREHYPGWSIWDGPWPGGETAADVVARADRLIDRLTSSDAELIALVGHGHFSRVLAARWVGENVTVGRWLFLDTGTWSELGWVAGSRALRCWNAAGAAAAND